MKPLCREIRQTLLFQLILTTLLPKFNSSTLTYLQTEKLLRSYGYLEEKKFQGPASASLSEPTPSNLTSNSPFKNALIEFQRFYKLPVTGKLDKLTEATLTRPRCGTSDKIPNSLIFSNKNNRSKRYVQGSSGWFDHGFKNPITFGLQNTAEPILSKRYTCIAILRAFRMWEQQANIRFQEVNYRLCIKDKKLPNS